MDNKKVSNLLRAVADLMDQTTEVVVETQKEIVKNVEKTNEDFLTHSLRLMRKIEENDTVRAYKNKLSDKNESLVKALREIQELREKALEDMVKESKEFPMDLYQAWDKASANLRRMGEHVTEEAKIMQDVVTK